jgi:hypothetical protein
MAAAVEQLGSWALTLSVMVPFPPGVRRAAGSAATGCSGLVLSRPDASPGC